MSDKVLIVDDEPNVLAALRRFLRSQFDFELAGSGPEALELCATKGPFAVVVSDMQMPDMNGVEFFAALREMSPDTVRIMLTGNADQNTAAQAVNQGQIFRFLNKPCPAEQLAATIREALEHYRLLSAEKSLIQKTLAGSVKVLTDILALVHPTTFGRSVHIRPLVREMALELNVDKPWECELAAMLCLIGCITIPEDALVKAFAGEKVLDPAESKTLHTYPQIGQSLIGNIARLEGVARIIGYQEKHFDGTGFPEDDVRGEDIPLGARILKVALDYDRLHTPGSRPEAIMAELNARFGMYDPRVLLALSHHLQSRPPQQIEEIHLAELREGMLLADHIRAETGHILVSKGHVITDSIRTRLLNFAHFTAIQEPIRVLFTDSTNSSSAPPAPVSETVHV